MEQIIESDILNYCSVWRSRKEICDYFELSQTRFHTITKDLCKYKILLCSRGFELCKFDAHPMTTFYKVNTFL